MGHHCSVVADVILNANGRIVFDRPASQRSNVEDCAFLDMCIANKLLKIAHLQLLISTYQHASVDIDMDTKVYP